MAKLRYTECSDLEIHYVIKSEKPLRLRRKTNIMMICLLTHFRNDLFCFIHYLVFCRVLRDLTETKGILYDDNYLTVKQGL